MYISLISASPPGTLFYILFTLPILSPVLLYVTSLVYHYLRDLKGFRKYKNQNWASGITYLAYGWEFARNHPIVHSKRLHDALQKDRVIRIGPNWLAFGRAQAVQDIYGYKSRCRKGQNYDFAATGGKNLVNISEKSVHSARRRMVASAYAPKNHAKWDPKIRECISVLMMQLDKRCTQPPESLETIPKEELTFDACHWMWLYSVETTAKLMLSKDVFFLRDGKDCVRFKDEKGNDQAIRTIHNMHNMNRAMATIIWDVDNVKLWMQLAPRLSKNYAENLQGGPKAHMAMEALVKERMERHANGEALDDLFYSLLENKKGEEPDISTVDRIAEVELNVGAASDGVAVTNAMTLYYLVRYPETLVKVRAEVDAALTPDDSIAPWEKIKHLPYLRACVDEAMRLAPPVATQLLRCTPADSSILIDGELIPPNTNVSISAYTSHRIPEIFPNPDIFDPDRWLAKGSDELKAMLSVFMPFTAGTRACIGQNISRQMQNMCLATLVYHYEFALPNPEWEIEFEEWLNLWPLKCPLKVWRRDLSTSGAGCAA